MSHVVSGKLRKSPFTKDGCGQDGQSKMYVIELAEVIKNWQTQENEYTNYKAMFFAKTDNAKAFYDKAFAEGSFVVIASEKIKGEVFNADNGNQYVTLNMDNPRLEGCLPASDMGGAPQQQQQYQNPPAQQPSPQMAPAYQSQQQPANRPTQGQAQQPPQPQNPASWGTPPPQQAQGQQQAAPQQDFDNIPF